MRKTFFLLSIFIIAFTSHATTYYVSLSGNDAANGTSPASSWRSISKVNATFFRPGDQILFNRGDIFYGALTANYSGAAGNPITYGAYGSGALPTITGLTTLSSWTNDGGGIYESTLSAGLTNLNMVTFQDALQPMGRWPKMGSANGGYLAVNSHVGTTSVTSTGLSGALNYTGGEIVARKKTWIMDKSKILTHVGSTITCVQAIYPVGGTIYSFSDKYGFFIQNHVNTCTQLGEWAYDGVLKKIKMYFGGAAPASYSIQVSTVDYLVTIGGRGIGYIIFDHIAFKGSNSRTFNLTNGCHDIQINNCTIKYSGGDAINATSGGGAINTTVNNCNISNTNNDAICAYGATMWTITNNTILNTGMVRGAGSCGDGAYSALYYIKNKSLIQNNVIKCTGYLGINYQGDSSLVKNNFIDSFDCLMRDGGAIYNYGDLNAHGRRVIGNIVTHGYGDNFGCGADLTNPFDQHVYGIYTDGGTKNVVIDGNTVAFCSLGGYHCNSATNITITNNTFYSNGIYQMNLVDNNMNPYLPNSGFTIKNNIFFATDPKQLVIQMNLASNYLPTIGIIDSNYYCRPINEPSGLDFKTTHNYYSAQADNGGGMADVNIPNLTAERFKSLDVWQTYSHQDAHSHKSPKTVTTLNDIKFVCNSTSAPSTTALGANYIDARGRAYNGTITLAPFTSAVLIKTGTTSANQAPNANAGPDQIITAPTSTITLSGIGTDVDGTIASYSWAKIAGAYPFYGAFANANSATSGYVGLVPGVYKFELKVTDNMGAVAKDTMLVTVNAAVKIAAASLVTPIDSMQVKPDGVANIPPFAYAGSSNTVIYPANTTFLAGSGTDPDGSIASYNWNMISGPSSVLIINATSAATSITGLRQGMYYFELKVTDNNGATGRDTVAVTVDGPKPNFGSTGNIVKIYPNPVGNTATLEINRAKADSKLLVILTDMRGQVLLKHELPSGLNNCLDKINMSNLSKGIYLATVYFSDQEKQSIKVIKIE